MQLENYIEKNLNPTSFTHDFSHLKRTAIGAKWFAKILGCSVNEQQLAYVSGLLHDVIRPPSHNIEHSEAAARKAKEILKKFNFKQTEINTISQAISEHGLTKNSSKVSLALFLSDKVLELMGPYIVFRRCLYIGESLDYKQTEFHEAIIKQFTRKMNQYNPETLKKFHLFKLVNQQFKWVEDFFNAFSAREKWAVEIAEDCYKAGKEQQGLTQTIKTFKPTFKQSSLYKEQALKYIEGELFQEFERLVK
jgi:HD superfamily phosphodiesterase